MRVIKHDESRSVLIDTNKGFNVWMDISEQDGELLADWNKYIFHLDNEEDVKIKAFQEDIENFDEASSLAIEYYEEHLLKPKFKVGDDIYTKDKAGNMYFGKVAHVKEIYIGATFGTDEVIEYPINEIFKA